MERVATYTLVQNIDHGKQAVREALAWLDARGANLTPREREAYEAGFLNGWRSQLGTLKLHAGLSLKD